MALQSSGAISLNDIHVEAGGTSGTQASLNDADIRGLISKASGNQMSFSEWYGASGVITEYGGDATSTYMNAVGPYPPDRSVVQTLYNNHPTVYACHFDIFFGEYDAASELYLTRRGVEAGWGSSPSYNIPYDWPDFQFPFETSEGTSGQNSAFLYTWNPNGQYVYRGGPLGVTNNKNIFISNYQSPPSVDGGKIQFPAYTYGGWNYFFKAGDPGVFGNGGGWDGTSFPVWRTTSSTYPF